MYNTNLFLGQTILHKTCTFSDVKAVNFLLNTSTNIAIKDKSGKSSPYFCCKGCRNDDMTECEKKCKVMIEHLMKESDFDIAEAALKKRPYRIAKRGSI